MSARRDLAFDIARHGLACPACGECEQLQVVNWAVEPMRWRCRRCRHAWTVATTSAPKAAPHA